jgi:hypothetical protein
VFLQQTPSRFLKVATDQPEQAQSGAVSRFLVSHPKVSRFIAGHPALSRFIKHIPGVSRFATIPPVDTPPQIAPVYNSQARKQRSQMLKM